MSLAAPSAPARSGARPVSNIFGSSSGEQLQLQRERDRSGSGSINMPSSSYQPPRKQHSSSNGTLSHHYFGELMLNARVTCRHSRYGICCIFFIIFATLPITVVFVNPFASAVRSSLTRRASTRAFEQFFKSACVLDEPIQHSLYLALRIRKE